MLSSDAIFTVCKGMHLIVISFWVTSQHWEYRHIPAAFCGVGDYQGYLDLNTHRKYAGDNQMRQPAAMPGYRESSSEG